MSRSYVFVSPLAYVMVTVLFTLLLQFMRHLILTFLLVSQTKTVFTIWNMTCATLMVMMWWTLLKNGKHSLLTENSFSSSSSSPPPPSPYCSRGVWPVVDLFHLSHAKVYTLVQNVNHMSERLLVPSDDMWIVPLLMTCCSFIGLWMSVWDI